MRYLNFFLLLILISCSTPVPRQDLDDSAYRTSGLEQFFMPELPRWANNSASGQCFKKHNFQYLDFPKLAKSYEMNYPQLIELQAQYNERLEAYFRSTTVRFVKPVEEAAFFSNTLEQVRGGVKHFKIPDAVKEVEVVWLDGFIAADKVAELKKITQTSRWDEKLPVLFSACMARQDLNQWLIEQDLDQVGFYSLTAEWLNPYGSDMQLKSGLHLEIKKLLKEQVRIKYLGPAEILLPTEIKL